MVAIKEIGIVINLYDHDLSFVYSIKIEYPFTKIVLTESGYLIVGGNHKKIQIFDTNKKTLHAEFKPSVTINISNFCVTPDSSHIVAVVGDLKFYSILTKTDDAKLTNIVGSLKALGAVCFSADGLKLFYLSGSNIFELKMGEKYLIPVKTFLFENTIESLSFNSFLNISHKELSVMNEDNFELKNFENKSTLFTKLGIISTSENKLVINGNILKGVVHNSKIIQIFCVNESVVTIDEEEKANIFNEKYSFSFIKEKIWKIFGVVDTYVLMI